MEDYGTVSSLFLDNGYWRDHLCLSWDFRTLKGREGIFNFLRKGCRVTNVEIDRTSSSRAPHVGPIDAFGEVIGVEFFTNVTTEIGNGRGVAFLAEIDGVWKFSTYFTSLVELKGHEESVEQRRPIGVKHGEQRGRKNWQEKRNADISFEGKNPAVVIVGKLPCYFLRILLICCRSWSKWTYSRCSSQNAQCRYLSYRQRGSHWGQLEKTIPSPCSP